MTRKTSTPRLDAVAASKHSEKLGKGYQELAPTKSRKSSGPKVVGAAKPAKVVSQKKPTKSELSLNDDQVLVGEYPKILDLREFRLETKCYGHLPEEFKLAGKEERLPQPNISISNNSNVEIINFPTNENYSYAVIENLPNLTELHICKKKGYYYSHKGENIFMSPWKDTLQWVICRNLPQLQILTVEGDIRWLQLDNMPSLKKINARGCKQLDLFSISRTPNLESIDVVNCAKLRSIEDMSAATQDRLNVTKQIVQTQAKSKKDLQIYKNMTFTDVDMVLAHINLAAKVATRKGLFTHEDDQDSDFCYGREDDPKFKSFSFNLLRPLEAVWTDGTGETFAYDLLKHDYLNGKYGVVASDGCSSQEDCLEEALSWVNAIGLDDRYSQKEVLRYLNQVVSKEETEVYLNQQSKPKMKRSLRIESLATVSAIPKPCAPKETVDHVFRKSLTPSIELAAVVGKKPLTRTEVVDKVWAYIKKNKLQDTKNRQLVNADAKLAAIFGKSPISMFEMAGQLNKHLK